MNEVRIKIDDGRLTFVYTDAAVGLITKGDSTTERASFVEPYDGSGGDAFAAKWSGVAWTADMSPSDGPVLGPFTTRQDALDAERVWLRERFGV